MRRSPIRLIALVLFSILGAGRSALSAPPETHPASANPISRLLELVPSEASLCFVLQNLRENHARVTDSPFASWVATTSLGKSILASPEFSQLNKSINAIGGFLGITPAQLLDDIFGDAVVLAYLPAPRATTDQESGLLMIKARDPDRLNALVDRLNKLQKESGDVTAIVEKKLNQRVYYQRQLKQGPAEYYRLNNGVFVASRQEHALLLVIRREVQELNEKNSPFLKAYQRFKLGNAVAALLFQPRALDTDWEAKAAATADPREKALLTLLAQIWRATDAIGLSLKLGQDAELELAIATDSERLPTTARDEDGKRPEATALRMLFEKTKPCELWASIPENALFATAGVSAGQNLLANVPPVLPTDSRAKLQTLMEQTVIPLVGKDQIGPMLKKIGPEWGIWVTAPEKGERGSLPSMACAVRVKTGTDGSLAKAAQAGLQFVFQSIRVEYNRTHDDQCSLGEATAGKDTIVYLANEKALPMGVRPAFALRGDYLVIASSVEAIQRFTPPSANASETGLLFRASVSRLSEYLGTHRQALAESVAAWSGRKTAEVEAEFAGAAVLLEWMKSVELRRSSDESGIIRFTIQLRLSRGLRK